MRRCLRCKRATSRPAKSRKPPRKLRGLVCERCLSDFRQVARRATREGATVAWYDRQVYGRPGPEAGRAYVRELTRYLGAA